MLGSDVGLLSYNVNRWFQREPEQRMIRTMDGRARAFLSNRYRRIDNLDIARVTLPIIGEMPEARYESCQLTEDYLYIKVVNPRLTAEVTPGDIVQAGIIISKMCIRDNCWNQPGYLSPQSSLRSKYSLLNMSLGKYSNEPANRK